MYSTPLCLDLPFRRVGIIAVMRIIEQCLVDHHYYFGIAMDVLWLVSGR